MFHFRKLFLPLGASGRAAASVGGLLRTSVPGGIGPPRPPGGVVFFVVPARGGPPEAGTGFGLPLMVFYKFLYSLGSKDVAGFYLVFQNIA